jgi:hypothetical protein
MRCLRGAKLLFLISLPLSFKGEDKKRESKRGEASFGRVQCEERQLKTEGIKGVRLTINSAIIICVS